MCGTSNCFGIKVSCWYCYRHFQPHMWVMQRDSLVGYQRTIYLHCKTYWLKFLTMSFLGYHLFIFQLESSFHMHNGMFVIDQRWRYCIDNLVIQLPKYIHPLIIIWYNQTCYDFCLNLLFGQAVSSSLCCIQISWPISGSMFHHLSVCPASETPKIIHFRVGLFHTPDIGLIDL